MAALIDALDDLYSRAVTDPASIDDAELAAWFEDVAGAVGGRMDKAIARAVRKTARNARRLSRYWSDPDRDPARLPDWRGGVDEILGAIGWQPHLDVARAALASDPSAAAFDEVKHWFRAVHFTEWMEDVTFEEWLDGESTA